MVAKFLVLNDIHLADHPPKSRLPGYQDQIFKKLAGIADYAYDNTIEHVIATGDIFHQKRPTSVSHALVNRVADCIQDDFAEATWYICPGNHDMIEAGIESLQGQPLNTLSYLEQVKLLTTEDYHTFVDGKNRVMILGRHFDTDGDLDPEHYVCTEDEASYAKRFKPTLTIMVAHGSLVPPGEVPIYPHLDAAEVPWGNSKLVPDILIAGHLHEDYGIHEIPGGPVYCNLGSLGRPSRNRYVDKIDFLTITVTDAGAYILERVPVPDVLPADEVFNEKAEEFEHDEAMAEFARALASNLVFDQTSIDDALDALGDIKPNVKARMKRYLEDNGY